LVTVIVYFTWSPIFGFLLSTLSTVTKFALVTFTAADKVSPTDEGSASLPLAAVVVLVIDWPPWFASILAVIFKVASLFVVTSPTVQSPVFSS